MKVWYRYTMYDIITFGDNPLDKLWELVSFYSTLEVWLVSKVLKVNKLSPLG